MTYDGFVNGETESVLSGALDYDYTYAQYGDTHNDDNDDGNYRITPKGLSSDNYAITFADGILTVNPKTIGLTWTPDPAEFVYNGSEQGPAATATGTVNDDDITVSIEGTQKNAGEHTAYASGLTGDKSGNYALPEENNKTFTIAPKEVTLTWENTTLTYNGMEQAPNAKVGGLVGDDACTVTVKGAIQDAGTGYTATVTELSNKNYTLPSGVQTSFAIMKKSVTVSGITAEDKAYDGTATATLNYDNAAFAGKLDKDALTVTATGAFADTEVGNAKTVNIKNLTLGGADAENYQLAAEGQQATATANITANVLNVTASGYSGAYDGAAHGITVTAPEGATVKYGATAGTYDKSASLTITDVSDSPLTVYYQVTKDHYTTVEGSKTVTISKADIPSEPAPSVKISGWTYGDTPNTPEVVNNPGDGVPTYQYKPKDADDSEYAETVPTNVGDYTVKATIPESSNYNSGAAMPTNFTISKRPVTVSGIAAENKTYDGTTTATLNYDNAAFAGKMNQDALTVTATGTFADANAGDNKTVTIGGLTLDGTSVNNYTLAESGQQETTTAAITAKTIENPVITLDLPEDGYTYNGTAKTPTVTVKDGDTVIPESEYVPSYASNTNAGTATVTVTDKDGGNYAFNDKSENFTISKKSVTVSGITAENKTYDGNTNAKLIYDNVTFNGIISGDELTVSATGTFADAETGNGKTVSITNLTLGGKSIGNYQLAANGQQTETTASITAQALNVTANGYSGVYDGAAHGITVNAPDGATVTYSETENGAYGAENPAYRNAGTYTVFYKVAMTGSADVGGSETVTISKKDIVISGITAANKPYDGNTNAKLIYDNVTFNGIISGDELTVSATGTFADAQVGNGKTVNITNLALGGKSVGNYQLAASGQQTETTANITANALNVTANGYSGVYDGAAHGITVNVPDGATVTYSENESGAYGAENPTYQNTGTYTVFYKVWTVKSSCK